MFKLSSIKVGMKYQDVRNEIIKSNNLGKKAGILGNLLPR